MALLDKKAQAKKSVPERGPEQPFAEIDAKKFERAQSEPGVKDLHASADRHLETLRSEGRID
jgi:hypothetical protein